MGSFSLGSLVTGICLPTMQETQVRSLGWEDPLEKEMAPSDPVMLCIQFLSPASLFTPPLLHSHPFSIVINV